MYCFPADQCIYGISSYCSVWVYCITPLGTTWGCQLVLSATDHLHVLQEIVACGIPIQCQCHIPVYDIECQLTPKICRCMAMQVSKTITVIWYK